MERKRNVSALPFLFGAIGALGFSFIGKSCELQEVPERIEHIQEHNAQLQEELEPEFSDMDRLILNDETDTYEFRVAPEGEQPQTCEGSYEVVKDVAQASGDIVCKTTVTLGG